MRWRGPPTGRTMVDRGPDGPHAPMRSATLCPTTGIPPTPAHAMTMPPEAMESPLVPPEIVRGRVVVAMSGGVDSSYVAAALAQEGFDVVGIAMRLYGDPEKTPGRSCCSPDDLLDARGVAERFGFPFYVANWQEAFQQRIVDYFVNEYRRGRTPSPCVLCNDHLKFDVLLERMVRLGGSFLATGHYARIEPRDGRHALLRGVDRRKDQSYFLFGLPRERLAMIRFPLGDLTKEEVRERAGSLGVPTATKPESQDICFIGRGSYVDFVSSRLAPDEVRPGPIVHARTGEHLGDHEGIHRFTIGQRRGLGVSWPRPLFVQRIDAESGAVHVAEQEESGFGGFTVERVNWLRWVSPPAAFECTLQVRYRQVAVAARVEPVPGDPTRALVTLESPEQAVSPGQAAVFYDGDEVVGGGWIDTVVPCAGGTA